MRKGRAGGSGRGRERRGCGCGMGEAIALGAPVPVEQAVLETFFSHLGIFSYDKAKDNVEKEREGNRSAGGSWLALLAALGHLAAAEKAYHSMAFLGQKLGTARGGWRAGGSPQLLCWGGAAKLLGSSAADTGLCVGTESRGPAALAGGGEPARL